MSDITTIGLDLAKHVFQVHGVDAFGDVVIRRQLRRSQVLGFFAGLDPCLVGRIAVFPAIRAGHLGTFSASAGRTF